MNSTSIRSILEIYAVMKQRISFHRIYRSPEHRIKLRWMATFIVIGLFAACRVDANFGSSATFFTKSRSWETKTGASFAATVVSVEKDTVVFKRETDGRETRLPIGNLIRDDERILRVAYYGQQDSAQLDRAKSVIGMIESEPEKSVEAFKLCHLDYPDSPYGGLWASVCLSATSNKNAEAAAMLRQVIARIERQREFDDSRHSMTWASTLNNLAVCMVKSHKADAAAGLFSQCLDLMPIELTAAVQNSQQLLQIGQNDATPLSLTKLSLQRLESSLLGFSTSPAPARGWTYSLDVDLPQTKIRQNGILGLEPPAPGYSVVGTACGLALSDDQVVASSASLGITDAAKPGLFTVTFRDEENRIPTSPAVLSKLELDVGLVSIRIPSGKMRSTGLGAVPTVTDQDVAVFSFEVKDDEMPYALQTSLGKLRHSADSEVSDVTLAQPLNGLVVNRSAQILGFVNVNPATTRGEMLSTETFYSFGREIAGSFTVSDSQSDFSQVRSACVLVAHWAKPDSRESLYLSQNRSGDTLSVRDPWCVACKGVGFFDCEYRNCNKGIIVVRKRTQVGFNAVTQTPIMGAKSYKQQCSKCGGRGGFKCPHCQNGRLR